MRTALATLAACVPLVLGACDRGPSCEDAADTMVEVANAGETEATKPEARERLVATCEREGWPADVRRCLARAGDQDTATACMRDLAQSRAE